MSYVRIAVYTLAGSTTGQTRQDAAAELFPFHHGHPGFIHHEVLTSADEVISISRWQSREHATEGAVQVAAWLQNHLHGQLTLEQHYIGASVIADR
ncbi:MAG TPA: hypothetical protein VMU89_09395 [Thermomicrobiaceae bacterium]|nr:hypothetical protein [Thermomicrobiaceae bacterium]